MILDLTELPNEGGMSQMHQVMITHQNGIFQRFHEKNIK